MQTDVPKNIGEKLPEYISSSQAKWQGNPAIVSTNEEWDENSLRTIRRLYKPDGYIYGVGAGNILATVGLFPNDTEPKGMVMTDTNPAAVLGGKVLRTGFKLYPTWDEFLEKVVFNREYSRDLETEVLETERNPELRELMKSWVFLFRLRIEEVRSYFKRGIYNEIFPLSMVKKRYPTFHKLAHDGNVAVILSDVLNPDLLRGVYELPEFSQSTNVVYLSNIWDYSDVSGIEKLRALNPQPPRRNIILESKKHEGRNFVLEFYTMPSASEVYFPQ